MYNEDLGRNQTREDVIIGAIVFTVAAVAVWKFLEWATK